MSLPRFLRAGLATVAAAALLSTGALVAGSGPAVAAVPTAPTGLTPNDPPDPTPPAHKDVILRWTAVTGATAYEVEVTLDTRFTNPVLSVTVPTPRYVPSVTLPHADYLWRVRAVSTDGTGPWSATAGFVRGWDVRPAGLDYEAGHGVFSWDPIGGAASYDVQFSTQADFGDLEQSRGGVLCRTNHPWWTNLSREAVGETDTECRTGAGAPVTPVLAGTYYWRVRGLDDTSAPALGSDADAVNKAGCQGISYEALGHLYDGSEALPECSRWSASAPTEVTIGSIGSGTNPGSLTGPTGISVGCPADACTNDSPVITWDAVAGAPAYKVSIGLDRIFGSAGDYVYGTKLPAVAPRISIEDRNRYYLAVQACYDDGCGVATVTTFTKSTDPVTTLAPDEVSLADPILLSWTDYLTTTRTLEAKEYHIQVARTLAMTAPVLDRTVDRAGEPYGTSEYELLGLADGTYYWRIQAIDASDRPLSWSVTRTFTVDTTGPTATITTPSGMPITGNVAVSFSEPVTGVSSSTLRLIAVTSATSTPGTVEVVSSSTARIQPAAPLTTGQSYRLVVSPAVIDQAGNSAVAGTTTVRTSTAVRAGSPALVERWDPDAEALAYAGAYAKSATRNAAETLTLRGPSVAATVKLYGARSPMGGWAHIYAGGVYRAPVSYYAPTVGWGWEAWRGTVPALGAGQTYTLSVVVQGTNAAASRGSYVYVDQWTVGATNYQEAPTDVADAAHAGGETWSGQVATDAANLTRSVRMEAASVTAVGRQLPTVTAQVAGRTVTVRMCRSPAAGYADILIDGVRITTVSLYQSYTSCGFGYTAVLAAGEHRVSVGVTGRTPTGSRGSAVAVDMISVT